MTIALGILTSTDVVIAADTQESWGFEGGAKISGYKILSRVVSDQGRAFAVTGSGSAGYIDSLGQELRDNFDISEHPVKAERRFREKAYKFYAKHVFPHYVLPRNERPSADILLGVHWNGRVAPQLWANQDGALYACKHYAAVGAGRAHATMLLSQLLPDKADASLTYTIFLAAYIIYLVKGYIEGCGMGTHITVLRNGQASYLTEKAVNTLERDFAKYVRLDVAVMKYINGSSLTGNDAVVRGLARHVQHTKRDLEGFIAKNLVAVRGEAVIDSEQVQRLIELRQSAK